MTSSLNAFNCFDSHELYSMWVRAKDDPHVSSFIPIDPETMFYQPQRIKAYLYVAEKFILCLPRSKSLSDRLISHLPPEGTALPKESSSNKRDFRLSEIFIKSLGLSLIAKLRKEDDLVTIMTRIAPQHKLPQDHFGNMIFHLKEKSRHLFNLESLDLSESRISTFPKELCPHLCNVKSIDLSRNGLEHTPLRFLEDLFALPSLEEIDLSFNSFSGESWSRIGALLPVLKNLKIIHLKETGFSKAPAQFLEALLDLPKLEVVDLSKNKLSKNYKAQIQSEGALKGKSIII